MDQDCIFQVNLSLYLRGWGIILAVGLHPVLCGFDHNGSQTSGGYPLRYPENFYTDKVILVIIIQDYAGFYLFRIMDTGIGNTHIQRIRLFIYGHFHGCTLLSKNTVITRKGLTEGLTITRRNFPAP
jgi:hypothetical protein